MDRLTVITNLPVSEALKMIKALKKSGNLGMLASLESSHPSKRVRKTADHALRELMTVK